MQLTGLLRVRPRVGYALVGGFGAALVLLAYVCGIYPWLFARGHILGTSEVRVAAAKACVALASLGAALWARRRARNGAPLSIRLRRLGIAASCIFAIVAWLNFGQASGWAHYVHTWDVFHYYVGSKYHDELGYTELYRCSVVAAAESSPLAGNSLIEQRIRELSTAGVERATMVLAAPERCKERFSAARWRSFVRDVAFFKKRADTPLWNLMLMDHGYQPPPLWTMIGGTLARILPATDGGLMVLASLDVLLIIATFGMLYATFGLRSFWAGLVFYGCQWPSNAYFMGGTFLRHDWLFASMAAVCLAARRRWLLSGALLAFAVGVRVVPVFSFGGWALLLATDLRGRRQLVEHLKFGRSTFVAGFVLLLLSAGAVGSDAYRGFVRSVGLHSRTPLQEQMGLPTILSRTARGNADTERDILLPDQFQEWRRARTETQRARRPVFIGAIAVVFALLALFLRRRPLWVALAIGPVLCAVLADVACYYYCFFLVLAPLARCSSRFAMALVGLGAASSGLIMIPAISAAYDDRFFAQSVLFLGFSCAMLVTGAKTSAMAIVGNRSHSR